MIKILFLKLHHHWNLLSLLSGIASPSLVVIFTLSAPNFVKLNFNAGKNLQILCTTRFIAFTMSHTTWEERQNEVQRRNGWAKKKNSLYYIFLLFYIFLMEWEAKSEYNIRILIYRNSHSCLKILEMKNAFFIKYISWTLKKLPNIFNFSQNTFHSKFWISFRSGGHFPIFVPTLNPLFCFGQNSRLYRHIAYWNTNILGKTCIMDW